MITFRQIQTLKRKTKLLLINHLTHFPNVQLGDEVNYDSQIFLLKTKTVYIIFSIKLTPNLIEQISYDYFSWPSQILLRIITLLLIQGLIDCITPLIQREECCIAVCLLRVESSISFQVQCQIQWLSYNRYQIILNELLN